MDASSDARFLVATVLGPLVGALFLVTLVGFVTQGPQPWLRHCATALNAAFIAMAVGHRGLVEVIIVGAAIAGFTACAMVLASATWRQPAQKAFEPSALDAFPGHAGARVKAWSAELEMLGWQHAGDHVSRWTLLGTRREAFARFYTRAGSPHVVELHALSSPRVRARMVHTRLADGTWAQTVDQLTDLIFFDDPEIRWQVMGPRVSMDKLIAAHDRMTAPARARKAETVRSTAMAAADGMVAETPADPAAQHVRSWNEFVERMRASGQLCGDDQVRVSPLRLLLMPLLLARNWISGGRRLTWTQRCIVIAAGVTWLALLVWLDV